MKTNPVFCGNIHVKEVKNGICHISNFETSVKNDAVIDKFVKTLNLDRSSVARQNISKENGIALWNLIEKIIGKKLEISENVNYSALCDDNFILFICQENSNLKEAVLGNCTFFDIYV